MDTRWGALLGLIVANLFVFSAKAGEIIQIKARLVDEQNESIVELTASTESGKWASVRQGKEIWYPTRFSPAKVYKSKDDKGVYSISSGKASASEWTCVVPHAVADSVEKRCGFHLRVKPTMNNDGTIQLEGEFTSTQLQGFKNIKPPVTVERKFIGKQVKTTELTTNRADVAVFDEVKKTISISRLKDVFHAPFPYSKAPESETHPLLADVETQNAILVLEASTSKKPEPKKIKEAERKKHIYITTRLIESPHSIDDFDFELPGLISDSQYQMLVRALNQKKGTDLLSAPSLILGHGSKGKVEVMRPSKFPILFKPPQAGSKKAVFPVAPSNPVKWTTVDTGVILEFEASLVGDDHIRIKARSIIRGKEEMIDYSNPVVAVKPKVPVQNRPVVLTENRIELPTFPIRESEFDVVVPNESTLLMTPVLDYERVEVIEKSPFKRTKVIEKHPRYLSILITASILDAAQ